MYQVLFYIPVKADFLPDYFPLPAMVALLILLAAGVVWYLAPREPFGVVADSWRNAAKFLIGFGVAVGVGMYFASRYWPGGIPVHGFGMMLFVAFLLCNWVGARLAKGVPFLLIARGPKQGREYFTETFPPKERDQHAQDDLQTIAICIFIGGLLGARITYLINETKPQTIGDFILSLPLIWEGGIIFYGSAIGGVVTYFVLYLLYIYYWNIRIQSLKLADIIAPCVALGLCLGRVGCLLNGCCYGQVACADCAVVPIHFPLSAPARYSLVHEGYQTAAGFTLAAEGIEPVVDKVAPHSAAAQAGLKPGDRIVKANDKPIDSEMDLNHLLSMGDWPRGARRLTLEVVEPGQSEPRTVSFTPYTIGLLPTQVFESISMFLLFWMLLAFWPLRKSDGQVLSLLMIGYAVHRYLNELLRNDPRPVGFESYGSVVLLAAGLVLFAYLWLRPTGRMQPA